jgi:type I restriction enzyme S subunit
MRLVPGTAMKLADLRDPIRFDWLADQGFRLDASPYLSGAFEARKLLERLPGSCPLHELVRTPNGIFHAGRVARRWVTDPEYGIPFLSSTDILVADSSFLPLMAKGAVNDNPRLRIERAWTLITRSGTIGRMTYARPDMDGFACSEDVLRVVARSGKIYPGYLYTFLSSKYGIPMIANAAYGAIIQHIEPEHIADFPVPRFDSEVEEEIHGCVQEAADLRVRYQAGVTAATRDLFESAGLPELIDYKWYREPRATGFRVGHIGSVSLRALNYDARAGRLANAIESVPHWPLGEICEGGELSRGNRFARIPAEPGHGLLLVGQEQVFWARPEGRWIAVKEKEVDVLQARDETIVVASQGLLTEGSLIGRAAFVTGRWLEYVYSEHLLRVRSGSPDVPNAYLFAFMRSEVAFRMLRSLVAGTGPQDINAVLRKRIPVPECTPADRERIAKTVRQAYRWRDEADEFEDRAQAILDAAVREATGVGLRQDSDLALGPEGGDGTGDG